MRLQRAGDTIRIAIGLLVGSLLAVVIACGGAKSQMNAPGTASPRDPIAAGPAGVNAEIAELDKKIDADLAAMNLAKPAVPPSACIRPPCDATAMSSHVPPSHTGDPSCKPGPSDTCRDSCRFSDSICSSSGRICKIATDLGGGDAYANEKCASGKSSCDAARTRCCNCQL